MSETSRIPLMNGLMSTSLPTDEDLVLASGSPRRAELLTAAGYRFRVMVTGDEAECGMCSRETAPELVARYAYRKAADVVSRIQGSCLPQIRASVSGRFLGNPVTRIMQKFFACSVGGSMTFTPESVSGQRAEQCLVDVIRTELEMLPLTDDMLDEYRIP